MADLFPPVLVPLVGRPEWEPYDSAGKISEDAQRLTSEWFSGLSYSDLETYVDQLLFVKHPSLRLNEETGPHVIHALKNYDQALEETGQIIAQAGYFSWETALSPSLKDMEHALKQAKDKMLRDREYASLILDDPELLEATRALRVSASTMLTQILGTAQLMHYAPPMNPYQILFDPSSSEFMKNLAKSKFLRGRAEAPSSMHWWPPSDNQDKLVASLSSMFSKLTEDLTFEFFEAMRRDMQDITPENRVNFKEAWRNVLEDRERLKIIRKEIRRFIGEQ